MINFVKVISSEFNTAKNRVVKFFRYGKSDVQTAFEVGPFGFDSSVPKDYIAVYAATGSNGETVIIGYLNKNQLANVGESRMYSTDAAGALKFYLLMKADGTAELGGNTKHLTRFEELEAGFNQLKTEFNAHVHGGAGTPPTIPSTASIAAAKINEIKTL